MTASKLPEVTPTKARSSDTATAVGSPSTATVATTLRVVLSISDTLASAALATTTMP
ncbi:hypothetical protein [Mycobacterium sp. SMC-8]|uniref:hypothetical protein n=1 Tax=Mycobacterium sp. SMC-8 TaxID=2857060 RepID=UPI0021B431E0|nr:hypothetical protein [Mycobacterium sp. SMC-8]